MEKSESLLEGVGETMTYLKAYVKQHVYLLRLEIAEKSANIISDLASFFLIFLCFMMFLFFISVTGALAIGQWIDSTLYGFLIVSGIYLVIGIIVILFKDRIFVQPMLRMVLRHIIN